LNPKRAKQNAQKTESKSSCLLSLPTKSIGGGTKKIGEFHIAEITLKREGSGVERYMKKLRRKVFKICGEPDHDFP